MKNKGLGNKNVPDAIEWHFAKYWDHMLDKIGLSKYELENNLKKSSKIIQLLNALLKRGNKRIRMLF